MEIIIYFNVFCTSKSIRNHYNKSNNIDESQVIWINEDSYLGYKNFKESYDWILLLKPMDIKDKAISKMAL